MYTLYGYPRTRSVRVAWALEEIGIPYSYHAVNLKAGEHFSEGFRKINPAGKIPALLTSEGTLSESAAILTFLADKHGLQEFIPAPGSFSRGLYEQTMSFLVTELEQPLWAIAKHTFALPAEKRLPEVIDVAQWEFNRALSVFSTMLGANTFLVDNSFSMVDVVAGHILSWARASKLDITHDNVASYADIVLSREAYERAWRKEVAHLSE
ncbi:glutathione S-transferase family protein [Alteromonas sp. KUL49]|uniref:glutathione S-transferase family protein n=1 Tax=Alteromonas sp. KUL49 TaxID=2480798 RepID=UPI00102F27BA|nr:glutathione S-transferase family protein [Alteromonas sp. KUL49]TAP41631.1 glutathione S-transferase family protein [Alteromonas sp. KUL49]